MSTNRPAGLTTESVDGQLANHSCRLAEAITAALPLWIDRSVRRVLAAQQRPVTAATEAAMIDAARAADAETGEAVRTLLGLDIDDQTETPLTLLRGAVRFPTAVLRAAGAGAVGRDDFARRSFPEDDYDLTPASFAEIDPSLHEPGIAWGAAKAFAHRSRHGGS